MSKWECEEYVEEDGVKVFFVIPNDSDEVIAEVFKEVHARIIAAAPDMLEASIAAFYHIVGLEVARSVENNGWEWTDDSPDIVSMVAEYLRAAISKAKGESK